MTWEPISRFGRGTRSPPKRHGLPIGRSQSCADPGIWIVAVERYPMEAVVLATAVGLPTAEG